MKTPAGVVVTPDPARRPPTLAVRPTRFVVSAGQYAVIVEERSPGWWAVCRDGRCLNLAGGWEIEPERPRRTEQWLRWHRFADLHAAMQSAVRALPSSSR